MFRHVQYVNATVHLYMQPVIVTLRGIVAVVVVLLCTDILVSCQVRQSWLSHPLAYMYNLLYQLRTVIRAL